METPKFENSEDYAQKCQRHCTFMNSISVQKTVNIHHSDGCVVCSILTDSTYMRHFISALCLSLLVQLAFTVVFDTLCSNTNHNYHNYNYNYNYKDINIVAQPRPQFV
jgi:hypothetical protein